MKPHLEFRAKITSNNLTDRSIRDLLYEAFEYNAVLAREDRLRGEYFEAAHRLEHEVPGVRDETFAENRIRHFREDFFSRFQGTETEKLLYLAQQLRYYHYVNEQPRALLDVVAPEFFKIFSQGEIWFVELNEATLNKVWADENKLLQTYATGSFGSPHRASGLEGGLSVYHWLTLMMYCFYPFVNGVVVTPDARLLFLLLPDQAINAFREYQFDLYGATEFDLSGIYGDSVQATRGIKTPFPEDVAVLSTTRPYFEWYIHRCNALLDQVLSISDLRKRFITTLTLNRLAVDTRIIEISELPYLMNLLFFGVLDKLANLYVQLGLESKEAKVWKYLLTTDFYESEVKSALHSIPGRVGEVVRDWAEWTFEHLEIYGPNPEVMRELRNSYHGYGIWKIDTLLSHSGELNNAVPALSNILWHWLLAKGLPNASILTHI